MRSYDIVQVEGTDDQKILDLMLPLIKGEYKEAGNKLKVQRVVQQNETFCGIVDRDFDSDEIVEKSRLQGSRVAVLRRYSLESYLLEPLYLHAYVRTLDHFQHPDWESPEAIEQLIIRRGQALSYYAAANQMLHRISKNMNDFQQLTPYLKPIFDAEEVRQVLCGRFQKLPTRDIKDSFLNEWEKRGQEIAEDCRTLDGVHRWINGKILLRFVMFDEIVLAYPKFSRSRINFVQDLADIAKDRPPAELLDILQSFGISPIGNINI